MKRLFLSSIHDWSVVPVMALGLMIAASVACMGIGDKTPAAPAATPAATSTTAATSAAAPTTAGVVKVTLTWDKPVDMDMEIWDGEGRNYLFDGSKYCGEDVKTGGGAGEFFEFKQYGTENFAAGKYVVSIFFAARGSESHDRSTAVVTLTKPDGSSVTRQRIVDYTPGQDQWHVFQVDAATGAMTDIDKMITTQPRNN